MFTSFPDFYLFLFPAIALASLWIYNNLKNNKRTDNILIHHICIQTNSYELSKDFYINILGFQLISETANFHDRAWNSWLREPGGFLIELQTAKAGGQFSPACKEAEGPAHLCFLVEDVGAEARRILAAGYDHFRRKDGQAVYAVLGSKLCKVVAPEGTIIELRDTAEL